MRKNVFRIFLIASAMALAACGDDTVIGGGSGTPVVPPGTVVPASINLVTAKPELPSEANTQSEGVTVTALVRDANNGVVSGAVVVFSVTNGASIITTQGTTDASGVAQAVVTTGDDPTNRVLTVTATASSVSDTVTINVVKTSITITGPTSAQFGQPATYTVLLADSGGQGIPSTAVTVSSADAQTLSATTLTTNASGLVTFTYTVNNTSASPDTLTATALGISDTHDVVTSSNESFTFISPAFNTEVNLNTAQSLTLRWRLNNNPVVGQSITFASTRGTVTGSPATTDVNGDATVSISSTSAGIATIQANSATGPQATLQIEFVATTPSIITVQAEPSVISTNSTSEITATVRDAADNLVKNVQVEFLLNDVTNGTISSPLVTTNSNGVAKVTYSSSSQTSATDGVQITARVFNTPSITDTASLTVGGRAARIVLGTGNEIFEPNETQYQFPYAVIVTDNNGAAASGARVFLSIESLSYGKGGYVTDPTTGKLVPTRTASCVNEDLNLNGQLDPAEDVNGNGELDPSNVAAVPLSVTVGSDGTFQFNITYPQDRGNWVDVRLTARTTVSGSEATESVEFTLPISAADADNPPGQPSPYGTAGACSNPN